MPRRGRKIGGNVVVEGQGDNTGVTGQTGETIFSRGKSRQQSRGWMAKGLQIQTLL